MTALLILFLGLAPLLYHFFNFRWAGTGGGDSGAWLAFLHSPQETSLQAGSPLVPESLPGAGRLVLGQKIDLNRSSSKDLAALPGIGPEMADRIVQDREKRGPFQSPEELMRVKGLKEKKFLQIKGFITVREDTSPKS